MRTLLVRTLVTLPPGLPPGRSPEPPQTRPKGPVRELDAADDRALVQAVQSGDARALEAIYARYGRPCYGLARRILHDEQLAQDVVQEVFLALWRDASRYDGTRGAFSSWLLSMTHHKAVDCVRREENLRKRRASPDALDNAVSQAPTPHDEAWGGVRRDHVRRALAELPDAQREALGLAYFGGYTQREISGLTSTPLGTVKTRMLAGMRKLREQLDGLADAEPSTPRSPRAAQ